MKASFRRYRFEDFLRIRDRLVRYFPEMGNSNWTIERWNFAYSMDRIMNGVTVAEWKNRIGIWECDEDIVAVVNSESEGGHAFIQRFVPELSESILSEIMIFIEENIAIEREGKQTVLLRIPENDRRLSKQASDLGYRITEWSEPTSGYDINSSLPVRLPTGYSIHDGKISDFDKGIAHAKAFGYIDKKEYVKRSACCYEELRKTPDYRNELDLHVKDEEGEIVAFCTFWYDESNGISIIEPLGTIPEYRRLGLAKALIAEGINRVRKMGANKVFVGSDQRFYKAIGFEVVNRNAIWKKES